MLVCTVVLAWVLYDIIAAPMPISMIIEMGKKRDQANVSEQNMKQRMPPSMMYQRGRLQYDGEMGASAFLRVFLDHERVDNGLAGRRTAISDFQLTQLEDLRNRPDVFAAKGVLAGVLDRLRVAWAVGPGGVEPFLHPGRSARIVLAGAQVGWLGELHPSVAAQWDLGEATVAGFELDLDAVPEPATPLFEDVTSFPEVREDLAVVVGDTVSSADVLAVVRRAGAPLLARAEVFDVYRNAERLGEGNVSLALRLVYRAGDRTLTDADVAARREAISVALAYELGGRIRAA